MSNSFYRIKKGLGITPGTLPVSGRLGDMACDPTGKFKQWDGSQWVDLQGSGGTINFVTNPDGSSGTTDWTTGSYSAAARPTGTFTASSGAGAFSISTTTTNPLGIGTTSFLLTKSSGASRQGRAIETSFALPLDYRAKVLQIDVSYIINSGTFVAGSSTTDSSLIWYTAFSTDNGATYTVAEPSSFKMLSNNTAVSDRLVGNIQTPANATHMKLIAYVAETANSAWEVKCVVGVSPCEYVYGTPITDWRAYTPVVTSATGTLTNYVVNALYRQVGDSLELKGSIVFTGTPGTWTFPQITFPSGLIGATQMQPVAQVTLFDSGSNNYRGIVSVASNLFTLYSTSSTAGAYAVLSNTVPFTWASGDVMDWHISGIKIQGWSSSVQVSDGYDGRLITFVGNVPSAQALTANVTNIILSVAKDSTASWTGSTYIVPSSGDYEIAATVVNSVTSGTLMVYVDGVFQKTLFTVSTSVWLSGSVIIPNLRAGQVVSFRQDTNVTISGGSSNTFSITKLASPQTMSATETLVCRYTTASGQTITSSETTILYNTKVFDTHNQYNTSTGVFTAREAGFYEVSASFLPTTTPPSGQYMYAKKNGNVLKITYFGATLVAMQITDTLQLNAGDTLEIAAKVDSGSVNMSANHFWNVLTIKKVK